MIVTQELSRLRMTPMVDQARELAQVPAAPLKGIDRKDRAADRFRREWAERDERAREESEAKSRERWTVLLLMAYLIAMFRQNPGYSPAF